MNEDELFETFVHGYCESGAGAIPEDWPRVLRERCRFFQLMLEDSGNRAGARSVLSGLAAMGIVTDHSLPEAEAPPAETQVEGAGGARERYVVEAEIARGGMGRILLAYDRDFRRRVAMKVMLGSVEDRQRASRFLQEAQTTAQLEHPNIAPVHDIGLNPGRSPYFTMKWIRGRDLSDLLHSAAPDLSLTRLIQILQQAAMGIHFANAKGVVHRDLKPRNIMVGDFGEVLVVDWGLAKVLGEAADAAAPDDAVSTDRVDENEATIDGSVQGSIPYMSPEQARGAVREIDASTDVFGLGAILYEILTGSAPYGGEPRPSALARARQGRVVPPRQRTSGREVPKALEDICMRALAPRKEDRYRHAGDLHRALQNYLEGIHTAERQALEAGRQHWVAEKLLTELRAAEKVEQELRAEETALRAELHTYDLEPRKKRLWELSETLAAAAERTAAELTRTTAAYLAVLSIQPDHAGARGRLADLFYERLEAAEERGDREAAALYRGLVGQYHDGRYQIELHGDGLLRLESDPAGATVLLCRYEEGGLLFRESGWEAAGATPLSRKLSQGSYLALLWKEGHAEARYPFVIDRGGEHAGRVRLYPPAAIPDGFVQVPGGTTIVGTSTKDFSGLQRRRVHVGDLFVGRFPVTFGEYCLFLDDRLGAAAVVPPELQAAFGKEEYIVRGPSGFEPLARFDRRMPVFAVTRAAALAYGAWIGERLGKRVRLLSDEEWERCARGADGRLYPWGNGFDWTLAKGGLSQASEPAPDVVGKFPRDASVFGVRDLAGGIRELCDGWAREGYRPCRGGSWFNPFAFVFRADFRTLQKEGARTPDVGFRVCYDGERPT